MSESRIVPVEAGPAVVPPAAGPAARSEPLRVGYVWQYEHGELAPTAATALHIQAVVRGLERRGHQVRTVTLRQGRPHTSDDLQSWQPVEPASGLLSANGRPFRLVESLVRGAQSRLRLPYYNLFESYRFSQAAARALAGCQVIYERFWLLGSGGLLAARRLGLPLIYEVNGDLVEEYAQLGIQLSRAQWAAVHQITRWMLSRAYRVVAVSPALAGRLHERWDLDPRQVIVVENGAETGLFAAAGSEPLSAWSARLAGCPVVMFVGSFKPWHGLDLLVDAFERLLPAHPRARLVLVGDGPERPALAALVSRRGLQEQVLFTGAVPHGEVASLLAAADVAVLNPRVTPASLAQSPLKLYEYMAAGKAIVAPATPNVLQVLQDGVSARLVQPNSAAGLAAALAGLLSDPAQRRALGLNARRQALAGHSWDQTAARLESLFVEALA